MICRRALIIAFFALLLTSKAALAASPTAYVGRWEDAVSQRAWLLIDQNWDEDFDVRVFWGSGIYGGSEWYMTATYDPTVGQIVYNNGTSYTVTYDGNGKATDYHLNYDGATGIIWIDGNGYLRFLCSDSSLSGCRFVWSGY